MAEEKGKPNFNQQQYDMLKRCSDKKDLAEWNEWRENNPHKKICLEKADLRNADLSEADLNEADLREADLRNADLSKADLSEANLNEADLREAYLSNADLREANLIEANLIEANLIEANLIGANLSSADLSEAYLNEANFSEANLSEANLNEADLSEADLINADLRGADFSEANLSKAFLSGAKLNEANLCKADLRGANLYGANLSGAELIKADLRETDLSNADLSGANLNEADLSGANLVCSHLTKANLSNASLIYSTLTRCNLTSSDLTGANLYGTSRDDWGISGVKCDYIYYDPDEKLRIPKDRDFASGEFEDLYKLLPTIEYVFENGFSPLDPVFMDSVVKEIGEKKPEYNLRIDSIHSRGLAPSIKFTVQEEDQKESALAEIKDGYERTVAKLEGKVEALNDALQYAIRQPNIIQNIQQGNAFLALNGSTININIEEAKSNIEKLKEVVEKESENSESFIGTSKKKVMDIFEGALEDVAKDGVKKVALKIIELGPLLGTLLLSKCPEAFEFFRNILQK